MRVITRPDPDIDGNNYDVSPVLAKEGFWLTVGKASIHVKDGDYGINIAIYRLGREDEDALSESYVPHDELEGEEI